MGDFLGFTFGGVHSSDLGITRISSSNRYNENLQPEIKDRTVEVPGLDGVYYFGSNYGIQSIDIDFAFDSLTEEQFRKLRTVFGTKQIKDLVFDERPYKRYMVKLDNPIELSYVCFEEPIKKVVGTQVGDERYGIRRVEKTVSETITDEETGETTVIEKVVRVPERIYPYERGPKTERIYKGDGKINFKAYFPYAKSVYKQLPIGEEESDWAFSSGILSQEEFASYGFDQYENGIIKIYNAGDIETGFRLYIPFVNNSMEAISISYNPNTVDQNYTFELNLENVERINDDEGIFINTTNGLIQGVKNKINTSTGVQYDTTGNLYNKYIVSGYFFKLQPGYKSDNATITINGVDSTPEIFYDYLYF